MNTKTTLVVMAAGLGSRYGGIKQLDPVGLSGETILEFGLYDAVRAGFNEVVFILRKEIEADFHKVILDRLHLPVPVKLVFQEPPVPPRTKPLGTAHAIWSARHAVDGRFAVMNADDFYGRRSYELVHRWLTACDPGKPRYALVSYQLGRTLSENGPVSRGVCTVGPDGFLRTIEEHHQLDKSAMASLSPETPVSMNLFGLTPSYFRQVEERLPAFLASLTDNPNAELYLPSVLQSVLTTAEATVEVLPSPETWFGITFQPDRASVTERIRGLIREGVYPRDLWGKP